LGNAQVLQLPPGANVPALLQAYQQSGLVTVAEPDYLVRPALTPNDPYYASGQLWHLHNTGQNGGVADADIDAPEAWDARTSASNILVAIVDTGVRFSHQDLAANMWVNPGEIAGNGVDDDGNGYVDDVHGINAAANNGNPNDPFGHGTQVAGMAGAVGNNGVGVATAAWRVRLMACRFYDDAGNGSISDAIECFDYARARGAHIINASFVTTGYSSTFYNTVNACRTAGILVVAAAGNDAANNDTTPYYPASFNLDNVIAVAASSRSDALASYSNYGATSVDLAAPGSELFTTANTSDSAYTQNSGTSFAAPLTASALALLKARFPSDTYLQLRSRLFNAVDALPALTGKCVTGGRLNLAKALGPPVLADFSASPSAGTAPLNVSFSDQSLGTITNWAWAFGDGASSSTQNPTHTYLGEGHFTATLTVTTDTGQTSSTNRTISVVANYTLTNGAYSWIDPAGMTALALADNGVSAAQPLPFSFLFYGQPQSQLCVGANGLVGFSTNGLSEFNNTDLPNTAVPNGILCPFWDDLNPASGGTIYFGTTGAAPNRKVVVSWVGVYREGSAGRPVANYTFQLWLEESTHRIQFQYQQINPGNRNPGAEGASATVGVEHSTGALAARYSYNSASLSNNQAILFLPPAAGGLVVTPVIGLTATGPVGGPFSPSSQDYTLSNSSASSINWTAGESHTWVSLNATSGTLAAGASTTVTVSINASANNLTAGSYGASVGFTNTTTGSGHTSREVSLAVNSPGQLAVSPSAALSSSGHVGGPFVASNHVYTLTNAGGSLLEWTATTPAPWLDLSPASGTLAAGASVTVNALLNAQAALLPVGTNAASLDFVASGGGSGTVNRELAVKVYPLPRWLPDIQASPTNFQAWFQGVPHWAYFIEVSTNLQHWSRMATNKADASGLFQFADPEAAFLHRRFYRAGTTP
jgi:subtilisin family serine protease